MAEVDPVGRGWMALLPGAWAEARSAFEQAVAQGETPEALDGLAGASPCLDDADPSGTTGRSSIIRRSCSVPRGPIGTGDGSQPAVQPDGTVTHTTGPSARAGSCTASTHFEAVNASNGTFLWKQSMGKDPASGRPVVPYSRARFSADGTMAFASAIAAGVYDHSFLFGIST